MGYTMTVDFKMNDRISPVLNDIGSNGKRVIAGMEEDFAKVNSSIDHTARTTAQASASLARLSGDMSGAASQSKTLAVAMADEAEKMRKAAQTAQLKADTAERMAEMARRHYNEIENEIAAEAKSKDASEHATKAMKDKAAAALLEAERLEKVSAELRKKADAAEKAADAAQENAQAALKVSQANEKLGNSTKSAASAEEEAAKALGKGEKAAGEYSKKVSQASGESRKLGKESESTAKMIAEVFATIGITQAAIKIKDAFAECSNAAIEYESALTGVFKTVSGTQAQLSEINEDIKLMSLEIPSTTTEIAGVAESAGQLGIATDNITDFTGVMINLDETTNLTSDTAASSLAKFSNITGMAADNYENLGSTVVALGNNFATTEADIVAMATRMASAGTLAGLTESDILGLAAAMSSVGITAEAGGSAMSTLLSKMQIAVETGNDSLNDFASAAGMTAEQFRAAFEQDAAGALHAFISGLNDVERNGATATVMLENMGITEINLSNTVKSLANNSEGLAGAVDLAGEAWEENSALAAEAEQRYSTLESRLGITKNAANNLKISIGDALTPVIGSLADAGTDVMVWLTDFCEENPMVVTSVTGVVGAVALLAMGLSTFSTAAEIATKAAESFHITLSAGKIIGVVGGIALLGAAIGGLAYYFSTAEDEVEDYNGTLTECRQEIEMTEMSYENVCKAYGENSEAAITLSDKLDTLNAQYEKGGGFVEEYSQKLAESSEAMNKLRAEYDTQVNEIEQSQIGGMIAVANLEALSEKAQLTNSDLDMMSHYADYLNDTFNCNIEVNYDTGELINYDPKEDMLDYLKEVSDQNRKQAAVDYITGEDFQKEYQKYFTAYDEARKKIEKYNASQMKVDMPRISWTGNNVSDENTKDKLINKFSSSSINLSDTPTKDLEDLKDEVENASSELKKYNSEIYQHFATMGLGTDAANEYIESLKGTAIEFERTSTATEEASEKMLNPLEAAREAVEGQADKIYELAQAYDEAYTAAYESFKGQFGLFDEAQMNTEATVENAQAALDSQLAYWTAYSENISYLSSISAETLGVTQANYDMFMSYLRSGDSEAVALMDNITTYIKNGNTEVVADLIETYGQVDAKQAETADLVAEWETNIGEHMNAAFEAAETSVSQIANLDGNVRQAARNIIRSYAQGINSKRAEAIGAARSLADAVQAQFNSVNIKIPSLSSKSSSPDNQYASGTISARAGLALVGERGPELVVLQGGERIYTAAETESILNNNSLLYSALNENEIVYNNSESAVNNVFSPAYSNIFSEESEYQNAVHNYTDKAMYIPPPESPVRATESKTENVSRREIALDINGNGVINVKGGMSKEDVVEVLSDYLKPVLMNILSQEIFEEGENTYEI